MDKRRELPDPLNAQERLLYAIAVRTDILIEQVGSIVDYISAQNNIATTHNKVEETIAVQTDVVTPVRKRAPRKKAEVVDKA